MMMKDEVVSWLNDEGSLVTSQRISQATCDDVANGRGVVILSRKDASVLLKDIIIVVDWHGIKYWRWTMIVGNCYNRRLPLHLLGDTDTWNPNRL